MLYAVHLERIIRFFIVAVDRVWRCCNIFHVQRYIEQTYELNASNFHTYVYPLQMCQCRGSVAIVSRR
jgi:hypothetical protein